MTRQELVDCLGTIAQSGTAKFLKALKVQPSADSDIFLFVSLDSEKLTAYIIFLFIG